MPTVTTHDDAFIVPRLRYHDAPAAIDWLKFTFGFELHSLVSNDDGSIACAYLALGRSMLAVSSVLSGEPSSQSGACTAQELYIHTAAPDVMYQRASASGAEIVAELGAVTDGGQGFTCRDREGHLWRFGSYDPWQALPATTSEGHATEGYSS